MGRDRLEGNSTYVTAAAKPEELFAGRPSGRAQTIPRAGRSTLPSGGALYSNGRDRSATPISNWRRDAQSGRAVSREQIAFVRTELDAWKRREQSRSQEDQRALQPFVVPERQLSRAGMIAGAALTYLLTREMCRGEPMSTGVGGRPRDGRKKYRRL